MSKAPGISIVPFQQLDGLVGQSEGHGIFVDCDGYRMNVGTILPYPDGKYAVTLMIMAEMQISRYRACDFSETYGSFEEASTAAYQFLASQRVST